MYTKRNSSPKQKTNQHNIYSCLEAGCTDSCLSSNIIEPDGTKVKEGEKRAYLTISKNITSAFRNHDLLSKDASYELYSNEKKYKIVQSFTDKSCVRMRKNDSAAKLRAWVSCCVSSCAAIWKFNTWPEISHMMRPGLSWNITKMVHTQCLQKEAKPCGGA